MCVCVKERKRKRERGRDEQFFLKDVLECFESCPQTAFKEIENEREIECVCVKERTRERVRESV